MFHPKQANNESRIKTLTQIRTKLKHYQTEDALKMLNFEDSAIIIGENPTIVSTKFGLIRSARTFGKKRTLIAGVLASYNDTLNVQDEIKKATGGSPLCEYQEPGNHSGNDFVNTTLLVVSPKKVLGWRTDMQELGVHYFAVESKDDFSTFYKKNGNKDPIILVCSINIYRKFIRRQANAAKIWRRVIFADRESNIYNGYSYDKNLKACFFWTTNRSVAGIGKFTHLEIHEKAILLENAIVEDSGQLEEIAKYDFTHISVFYGNETGAISIKHSIEKDKAVEYINEKMGINKERLETIREDISGECSICNETMHSKLIMLCCSQVSCVSCLKKHIRASNSISTNFKCMFCRAHCSTDKNAVVINSTGEDEIAPSHPLFEKIQKVSSKKALIVVANKGCVDKVVEIYPDAIAYGDINTFPRINKIYEKILVKQQYMIVLTRAEFLRINSHRILSKITDLVNDCGYFLGNELINPGRNPVDTLNIYSMIKNE